MENSNFYKIVKKLQDLIESNVLVNEVIYARTEDKDLYKNTLFPLVHINPAPSPYVNSQSSILTFEIGVYDIRTQSKQSLNTRFEGNDNIIDTHSTCYAILNEILSSLDRLNEDQIYLSSVSELTPIYFSDKNGIDGYVTTIQLKAPNRLNLC